MNKVLGQFVFLSLLLPTTSVRAEQVDLVSFPTGNAAWTVDMTPSTSAPAPNQSTMPPPRQVAKAEVTQVDNIRRIQLTWTDGKTTEKWAVPNLPVTFEEDPRNGNVVPAMTGDYASLTLDFFLSYDSPAFSWMTPKTLKEKDPVSYLGKYCYHYLGTASMPMSKIRYKREAWIEVKTLLPVAYDNGLTLSVYKFQSPPPVEPLVMPPKFDHALKYYKNSAGF